MLCEAARKEKDRTADPMMTFATSLNEELLRSDTVLSNDSVQRPATNYSALGRHRLARPQRVLARGRARYQPRTAATVC